MLFLLYSSTLTLTRKREYYVKLAGGKAILLCENFLNFQRKCSSHDSRLLKETTVICRTILIEGWNSETVAQRCSLKEVLLKISQN